MRRRYRDSGPGWRERAALVLQAVFAETPPIPYEEYRAERQEARNDVVNDLTSHLGYLKRGAGSEDKPDKSYRTACKDVLEYLSAMGRP